MISYLLANEADHFALWVVDVVYVALLGLLFGSFASAIIHRVPKGVSWVSERSKCGSCKNVLKAYDLIPVFSWLFNGGKCRVCGAQVSAIYPVLELCSALVCVLILLFSSEPILQRYILIFAFPIILSLAVIDLHHKILPNSLMIILACFALLSVCLAAYQNGDYSILLFNHGLGAVVFGGFSLLLGMGMEKLRGKQALGMGDVKFFAVAGLWLGLPYFGVFCILSGIFGVFLGLVWRVVTKEQYFPFGPALILSFLLILILRGSFFFEKALHYFVL